VRNFHGRVLPVFDLALALGGSRLPAPSRLVVADSGGCVAGFAVDDVTDVGPLPDGRSEPESEFLSEAVLADGALVGVVRLDRLFAALGSDVA
jgi:chemotaxis signal transduction protein